MKDTFNIHKWNKERYLAENKIEEAAPVELPNIPDSILNKLANQIKTPQTMASAVIAFINKAAEKENETLLNSPKLKVIIDKLNLLAQEEPKGEVEEEVNEGDLFSSKFDRPHLKDIIRNLNKGLILDMPTREAYKFLVSLLDAEDKEELGLNENIEEIVNENLKDKAKEALRKIQIVAKEKGQNVKSFLKDADGIEIMSALFPGLTAASSFMEEEKNDKI